MSDSADETWFEDLQRRAEAWTGDNQDAEGRLWWPEHWVDEASPPGRPSPQDWIDALPEDGENVPIRFCWQKCHGDFEVTRNGLEFSGLPDQFRFPENTQWWVNGSEYELPDCTAPLVERLREAIMDERSGIDIEDGETFTLSAVQWSTSEDDGLVWHLHAGKLVQHGSA